MKLNLTSENMFGFALALFAAYAAMLVPADAWASVGGVHDSLTDGDDGSQTGLARVLCNVVAWFQGPIGAGLATLAIIVIGVGALMGKVSWGMAMIVGLGVGVIFSAPQIVRALGGTTAECV